MQELFWATFIIELLLAVGFLAIPQIMLGNFGIALDPFGIALVRLCGASLLTFCTLVCYARISDSPDLKRSRRSQQVRLLAGQHCAAGHYPAQWPA